MAPDKIYASFINNGRVMTGCSIHPFINSSEYIRKDALLEWVKEKNERIGTDDGDYSLGYVSAMIDLIDKLNSM